MTLAMEGLPGRSLARRTSDYPCVQPGIVGVAAVHQVPQPQQILRSADAAAVEVALVQEAWRITLQAAYEPVGVKHAPNDSVAGYIPRQVGDAILLRRKYFFHAGPPLGC
jgi:hypothetical protein